MIEKKVVHLIEETPTQAGIDIEIPVEVQRPFKVGDFVKLLKKNPYGIQDEIITILGRIINCVEVDNIKQMDIAYLNNEGKIVVHKTTKHLPSYVVSIEHIENADCLIHFVYDTLHKEIIEYKHKLEIAENNMDAFQSFFSECEKDYSAVLHNLLNSLPEDEDEEEGKPFIEPDSPESFDENMTADFDQSSKNGFSFEEEIQAQYPSSEDLPKPKDPPEHHPV